MKKQLILFLFCSLLAAGSLQANDELTKKLHSILNRLNHYPGAGRDIPLLLFRGADPLAFGSDGLAAVHYVARRGLDNGALKLILDTIQLKGGSVDFPDQNGYTALCHAAQHGQQSAIGLLKEYGADVNYQTPNERYTPLHFAVFSGQTGAVNELKRLGAIEVEDARGYKPSRYARRTSVEVPGNRNRAFANREKLLELLETEAS